MKYFYRIFSRYSNQYFFSTIISKIKMIPIIVDTFKKVEKEYKFLIYS